MTRDSIVAGSWSLLSLFLAVPLGRLVDRRDEWSLVLAGTVGMTLLSALLLLADSLLVLGSAYALLGLSMLMNGIGIQALHGNRGDTVQRDRGYGAMTVMGSLGQMIGPALAGWVATGAGLSSVFLLGSLASAAGSLVVLPHLRHRRRHGVATTEDAATPRPPMLRVVRSVVRIPSVPHAMVASLTVLASIDILTAYLPALGEAQGIPVATVSMLLTVRAGLSLASRLLMTPLLRRFGRRWLLGASIALPAVALLALPSTTSTAALVAIMAIAGFGLGLGQPLSLTWVASRVPANIRGTALGLRLTGNQFGQLAIPAGVGLVAGGTGIGGVFLVIGCTLAVSCGLVARSPFTEDPIAAD